MKKLEDVGVEIQFEEGSIWIGGKLLNGSLKPLWNRLKGNLKKGMKS